MRIVITGCNGFLGQFLIQHFYSKNVELHGIARGDLKINNNYLNNFLSLDLSNVYSLRKELLNISPDIIIHTAALSKPDECEKNHAECIKQNVVITENLVQIANTCNAKLIFISTDFVFGDYDTYTEKSQPNPINYYGYSKWIAEKFIMQHSRSYAIVRPVFMYGEKLENGRHCFVQWIKNCIATKQEIKIVNDQYRTPTYVKDVCNIIENLVFLDKNGIYHAAGSIRLTPYEISQLIATHLKTNANHITPTNTATLQELARRPYNSLLSTTHTTNELGVTFTSFEEGLKLSLPLSRG